MGKIGTFFSEVKVELTKASWPWEPKEKGAKKYKELIDSTLIVLIAMVLLSGYVAGWDFVMNIIIGSLFKTHALTHDRRTEAQSVVCRARALPGRRTRWRTT